MLLDTSILVDILRVRPDALAWLDGQTTPPSLSAVSLMELHAGCRSQREEGDIARIERTLKIHPVDAAIARRAGVFVRLYQASHALDDVDALIAATAEHYDVKLATLNVKHFPMFAKLRRPY